MAVFAFFIAASLFRLTTGCVLKFDVWGQSKNRKIQAGIFALTPFIVAFLLGRKRSPNMLRIGLDHTQIIRCGGIGFPFALLPTFDCIEAQLK